MKKRKITLLIILFALILFGRYAYCNILTLDDLDIFDTFRGGESSAVEEANNGIDKTNSDKIIKGYQLTIDLDMLVMFVYKDGELLKTYPVSGGKPSTPSPCGTWKIISKANWGEGFGGAWMGFNVPWGKYGLEYRITTC